MRPESRAALRGRSDGELRCGGRGRERGLGLPQRALSPRDSPAALVDPAGPKTTQAADAILTFAAAETAARLIQKSRLHKGGCGDPGTASEEPSLLI